MWVTNGGRAEVQFDDGSLLRLGSGALVTLQTLYSNTDGEYTEIQMTEGLASLELRHATSIFQVDTPFASVKAAGPAKVRVGVNDNVEVAVRDGSAAVEGAGRKIVLRVGDYLNIPDANAAYQAAALPGCRTAGTAGTTAETRSSPTPTVTSTCRPTSPWCPAT